MRAIPPLTAPMSPMRWSMPPALKPWFSWWSFIHDASLVDTRFFRLNDRNWVGVFD
jgi:hypothetical protein